MALTPTTLQTIITAVRQRANMENNQFVTDAELTTMINNSLSQLDMILVSKFNDYKLTNTILTASSTTGQIALPVDFLKLRGVDVQYNASDPDGYYRIEAFEFPKRNRKPYGFTGPVGYGPYCINYRLQGSYIQIEPVGLAAQWPYRIWYTPDYVLLVNPTDTLQSYMDSQSWYQYAIVDVAAMVLAKQDLDPSTFLAQKAELREMILRLSTPNRDAGSPVAMTDTRGWGGMGGGWDF